MKWSLAQRYDVAYIPYVTVIKVVAVQPCLRKFLFACMFLVSLETKLKFQLLTITPLEGTNNLS